MTAEEAQGFFAGAKRNEDRVIVGSPTQDAAKTARRQDAKNMKNVRQPDRPDVGRIVVGQNADEATRQ
jgi:hypothetical protein